MMDVILSNLAAHAAQVTCVAAAGSILPLLLRLDPRVRYHYWRLLLAVCLAQPWLQGRVVTPSGATDPDTWLADPATSGWNEVATAVAAPEGVTTLPCSHGSARQTASRRRQ